MERTYNDLLAENKRLQDSLDVMIDKNAELIFREKTLKATVAKYDELRKEFAFVFGQLNTFRLIRGLPTYEEEKANESRKECKVISINQ